MGERVKIIHGSDIYKKKTHFMTISMVMLVLTMCVYYALQMAIVIPMYGILHSKGWDDFNWTLIIVLLVVALVMGIFPWVFAIIGAIKNENPHTMVTIVVKSMMIPFFCINLLAWVMLVGGLMNPFLLLTIPAVICIGVCMTYVFMLTTSLPEIIYMIIFMIKQKKKPKLFMVIGIVCLFFFVLDIPGSVFIHREYKKITSEA